MTDRKSYKDVLLSRPKAQTLDALTIKPSVIECAEATNDMNNLYDGFWKTSAQMKSEYKPIAETKTSDHDQSILDAFRERDTAKLYKSLRSCNYSRSYILACFQNMRARNMSDGKCDCRHCCGGTKTVIVKNEQTYDEDVHDPYDLAALQSRSICDRWCCLENFNVWFCCGHGNLPSMHMVSEIPVRERINLLKHIFSTIATSRKTPVTVLEVGAGIGLLAKILMDEKVDILATDKQSKKAFGDGFTYSGMDPLCRIEDLNYRQAIDKYKDKDPIVLFSWCPQTTSGFTDAMIDAGVKTIVFIGDPSICGFNYYDDYYEAYSEFTYIHPGFKTYIFTVPGIGLSDTFGSVVSNKSQVIVLTCEDVKF